MIGSIFEELRKRIYDNLKKSERVMKQFILTALLAMAAAATCAAQNYMTVDSEKIFKSIADYNAAIEQLDKLAESYQKQVDAKYTDIEQLYTSYVNNKSRLTAEQQQAVENAILEREEEAAKYQESLFGSEGELMKERVKLIQPIQKRVFAAIEQYAAANGFDLVIDTASNPAVLYSSSGIDRTAALIEALK